MRISPQESDDPQRTEVVNNGQGGERNMQRDKYAHLSTGSEGEERADHMVGREKSVTTTLLTGSKETEGGTQIQSATMEGGAE